jgi:tetratricopeptide (TPR) repeat protein
VQVVLTTHDTPGLRAARRAWAKQRYDEALLLFDQAVRLEKTNVRALVDAARAHGFRYQYRRAEELTDQLLHLAPKRADAWLWAGETYRMIALLDRAAECFERSCQISALPQSMLELAALYERQHRLDEAADMVQRVLAIHPRHPGCRLLKARIERRGRRAAEAESTLRDLIALPPENPDVLAEAWGELAALYDEQGRYDEAWSAICQAKDVQLARDAPERQAADFVLARFRRMMDTITAEDLRRWADAHRRDKPGGSSAAEAPRRAALLTGFPRSGTTLLEQVLDSHPGLVSSEERDVFSREIFPSLGEGVPRETPVQEMLHRASEERIAAARRKYFACMEAMLREPIGDRVHLDKNPAMNLMIPAMLRVLPQLRLLVALRDPRDVVVSCFLRYLPLNPVSVCFLTIERTAERYALDLRAWLKLRDLIEAPWIEVRYEDTVADLPRQARRALDLLGLPWDDAVLAYRDRAVRRQVLSPTYEAVTRPIYKTAIGRWHNYERQLAPVMGVLEPLVRELGYSS